jgi:hypothetical protein
MFWGALKLFLARCGFADTTLFQYGIVAVFTVICLFLLLCHLHCRLAFYVTRSSACLVGKTAIVTGANSGKFFHVLEEMITF